MTGEDAKGEGSGILRVVQGLVISPQDAEALVARHRDRFFKAHPAASERDMERAVSRAIVSRYARLSATSGGVTALAGVLPGVGTAVAMLGGGLADVAISMKLQADMTLCLAGVHGWDLTSEDARHLSYLIAAGGSLEKAGVEKGVQIASKAGVRMLRQHLRGAALQAAKDAFRRVGLTLTRTGLEKAVPFGVGVAVGSTANYALTRYVGRTATRWFVLDAEMRREAAHDPTALPGANGPPDGNVGRLDG